MNTQSAATIPYLDGWRGLAILIVLFSHFSLAAGGELGVALFFVLSGYLVSGLLFQREVSLATFFWRRATRILPTLWLYLAVTALCAALWEPVPYKVPFKEMLATLTFLRTYLPAGQSIWSAQWPIGHLWSLNVEEHAYLLLAVVAAGLRRIGHRKLVPIVLIVCIVVMSVTIVYYSRVPPIGASPWVLRSECAGLGLIASACLRAWRPHAGALLRQGHWVIAPLALGASLLCYLPRAPYLAVPGLAPLLLAVAVNYLDCAPVMLRRFLSLALLRWFGLCSFSLYMWQQPFYKAIGAHGLSSMTAFLLALTVGIAASYAFEKPLRRFLNRVWVDRQTALTAAA